MSTASSCLTFSCSVSSLKSTVQVVQWVDNQKWLLIWDSRAPKHTIEVMKIVKTKNQSFKICEKSKIKLIFFKGVNKKMQ
jgi:hypothetical protein